MPQTRIFTETDTVTAKQLLALFEHAFEDEGYPVSAFEEPNDPESWTVSVYVERAEADDVTSRMNSRANDQGVSVQFEREDIPDTDWVAATLRDLTSVRAGSYIVHGSHEADVPKEHEISILIDAGLAFGTGHHGTTAGCLDMLTRVCKRKTFRNVLDLGTGSGVLGIAAAKTMPCNVLATDIDPVATETAAFNCMRNGVHAYVECITATGFNNRRFGEQAPFDLVIANILAKPLQSMALDLSLHTASGGTVILSGLLPHQRAQLVAAFRIQGMFLEHYHIRENWLTLVLQKP